MKVEVKCDWPKEAKGKARVEARLEGRLIHLDMIDPMCTDQRDRFVSRLQEIHQEVDISEVKAQLLQAADDAPEAGGDAEPLVEERSSEELLGEMSEDVRRQAEEMLRSPDLMNQILRDVAALGVVGEALLIAALYLIGVSRLLDKPLAAIIQGASSSGKSYPISRVSSLFPPEAVIYATDLTPQSLYYLPAGSLAHRLVVAGERSRKQDDDVAHATRALREMISEGRLDKVVTVKVGGRMKTERIRQDGPIAYVESTTLAPGDIFPEDLNRAMLLQTDEGTEQTRRILKMAAAWFAPDGRTKDVERIIQKHHAMQRMLKGWPVVVPYADALADLISPDRVEARRAIGRILGTIAAVTVLHQYQRERDAEGRLIATPDDYEVARYVLERPMEFLLSRTVSDRAIQFYEKLSERFFRNVFWTTDAYRLAMPGEDRRVRDWLRELERHGYVKYINRSVGAKPAQYLHVSRDDVPERAATLPSLAAVTTAFRRQHAGSYEEHVGQDEGPAAGGFADNRQQDELDWEDLPPLPPEE